MPELKKFSLMFIFALVFYSIAISLWMLTGSIFYLINFFIIGTCLSLGMGLYPVLPNTKKHLARKLSQLLVGGYMFFGLGMGFIYVMFGVIQPENMQIEGFFMWLFAGIFQAAVLHYFIAKIFGPLIFNRGWCGWACWTAGVLDLLPFKSNKGPVRHKLRYARYLHFAVTLVFITLLVFVFGYTLKNTEGIILLKEMPNVDIPIYENVWQIPELWWFLIGNLVYFVSGITLAYALKDNRAFCKYICPITFFLKLGSRASLLKIKGDKNKCTSCGACNRNCPMDIDINRYILSGKRVTSSECIICKTCTTVCPNKALSLSLGFDLGKEDYFRKT